MRPACLICRKPACVERFVPIPDPQRFTYVRFKPELPACDKHACTTCRNALDLDGRICSICKIAKQECFLCDSVVGLGFFCSIHKCSFCSNGAEYGHCDEHKTKQPTTCMFPTCGICRQYPTSSACTTCPKCQTCSRTLIPGCQVCDSMPTSFDDRRCEYCSCLVCSDVQLPGKVLCKRHKCMYCDRQLVDGRCSCMCVMPNCLNAAKSGQRICDSHKCDICKVTDLSKRGHCSKCHCLYCNTVKLPDLDVCSDHHCKKCRIPFYQVCAKCKCAYCMNTTPCPVHTCGKCKQPTNGTCQKCKCRDRDCSRLAIDGRSYCDLHSCPNCRGFMELGARACDSCKCSQCPELATHKELLKNHSYKRACSAHYCVRCGKVKEYDVCPSCSVGHECKFLGCRNIVDERSKLRQWCVMHNCQNCRTINGSTKCTKCLRK